MTDKQQGLFGLAMILIISVLGYAFYVLEGIAFWGVLLGYPLLCSLVPISLGAFSRWRDGTVAFVSSFLFSMLLGAGLFALAGAWLFSLVFSA